MIRSYGGVPVPYTVAWSGEERGFIVDRCLYSDRRAICQAVAPGEGKPRFGKPHYQRQREAVVRELCDLCGRSLRHRTKVSLSHARVRSNGAQGPCVMQVEPLLHRECAAESLRHCPSLKNDVRNGTLFVRQVKRSRPQISIIAPQFVDKYVPDYRAVSTDEIAGHAKVELIAWTDRDGSWLAGLGAADMRGAAA